jgi:hypothetical protein
MKPKSDRVTFIISIIVLPTIVAGLIYFNLNFNKLFPRKEKVPETVIQKEPELDQHTKDSLLIDGHKIMRAIEMEEMRTYKKWLDTTSKESLRYVARKNINDLQHKMNDEDIELDEQLNHNN